MRGPEPGQVVLFSYVALEERIPADHPLRILKTLVEPVLAELSPRLADLYARTGRSSIPPEQLLRALLLQVLYTIRSERQLIEQLDYNLLFRWFVGLGMDEPVWHPTTFTKNRDRWVGGAVAEAFLAGVLRQADARGLLSKEQQLGLFGELWFLSRWLCAGVGSAKAIQMWRGPTGARNDFELQGMGIEVKTTGRLDAAHMINGLDQLLEPMGGALFLYSLSVRDEASGTQSLPRLVEDVRGHLALDYKSLSQFEATLAIAGYDERLAPEYAKLVLRIRDEGFYRVAGAFPRLIPISLAAGVPPGVNNVTYELRLDAAANWLVAKNAAAAATLLADFTR